jgi:Rieske Fe-S protein
MNAGNHPSPRRQFIKTFTLLSATSTLLGKEWTDTVLAQVLPQGGVLRVKITDFPALQTDFGSVRIGTCAVVPAPDPGAPQCTKPRNTIPSLYPLIINRAPGTVFHVLGAECPHASCAVAKFTGTTNGNMLCTGHGSRFRIDGSFIVGSGPANLPLISYAARFDGSDTLRIELPEIFFELLTSGVASANTNKLGLRFLSSTNITYEVKYRETLAGPATNLAFSLTPNGATQSSFGGIDDFVTVYVERKGPAGFYQIAMQVSEV